MFYSYARKIYVASEKIAKRFLQQNVLAYA